MTSAALWRCSTISSASKFKFYKSLVTSILVYGCETWTLLADSEKKIQAFETKCVRKLIWISYSEHKTNDWVRSKNNFFLGPQEPLLATVKSRKLAWFGHLSHHENPPSGHLGGWTTLWSAEEMLGGQHQRVNIPAYARTAHKGLVQKRLAEDFCWIVPGVSSDDPVDQGTELNWVWMYEKSTHFNKAAVSNVIPHAVAPSKLFVSGGFIQFSNLEEWNFTCDCCKVCSF